MGMQVFSNDELIQILKKKKMNSHDIWTALTIGIMIQQVDSLFFPNGRIFYIPKKGRKRRGVIAIYIHDEDAYGIYVKGVREKLIEGKLKNPCLCFKKGKKWHPTRKMDERPFTPEEVIVAIAAHEVRHRIQSKLNIEWFSYKTPDKKIIEEFPIPFNWIVYYTKALRKYETKTAPIRKPHEFDAKVIELVVLHFYRYLNSLLDLKRIILLQPNELQRTA